MGNANKAAYWTALLLQGVLVILVLLSTGERYNPEWFHGVSGDDRMAWGVNWAMLFAFVFALQLLAIAFSHKRLIFIPLYVCLFVIGYSLSFVRPARYLGQTKVQVQCDNHSKYLIRNSALALSGKYIVYFGRLPPSSGKGASDYVPNDGKVELFWEKEDGSHLTQSLKLWSGNKPPKNVSIIIEDDAAKVIGMP